MSHRAEAERAEGPLAGPERRADGAAFRAVHDDGHAAFEARKRPRPIAGAGSMPVPATAGGVPTRREAAPADGYTAASLAASYAASSAPDTSPSARHRATTSTASDPSANSPIP